MAAPVSAPFAPSYATYTPYISPAEFLAEPTGVDTSQLIPRNSSPTAQTAALVRIIGRASSWADQICRKVLAATLDVQSGEYRVRPDGTIRVPVDNTPLIQVVNVSTGWAVGQMLPLADLSGCRLGPKVVRIPVTCAAGVPGPRGAAASRPGWVFADVTYVNGWAHAPSTAAVSAGAVSLTVLNPLGVFPALPLTVYDGTSGGLDTEQVIVASTYTGGPVVPLVAPLLSAHPAGVSVSALPGFVREAVIRLTCELIKTRGSNAYVMPSGPGRNITRMEPTMPGAGEDYDIALELLEPLRRVW
jgi:hypothetical protein